VDAEHGGRERHLGRLNQQVAGDRLYRVRVRVG